MLVNLRTDPFESAEVSPMCSTISGVRMGASC